MNKEEEKKKLTQEIENIMMAANREIAKRQGQIELLDKLIAEEEKQASSKEIDASTPITVID